MKACLSSSAIVSFQLQKRNSLKDKALKIQGDEISTVTLSE